jgi:hypothetical protein
LFLKKALFLIIDGARTRNFPTNLQFQPTNRLAVAAVVQPVDSHRQLEIQAGRRNILR